MISLVVNQFTFPIRCQHRVPIVMLNVIPVVTQTVVAETKGSVTHATTTDIAVIAVAMIVNAGRKDDRNQNPVLLIIVVANQNGVVAIDMMQLNIDVIAATKLYCN